MLDVRRLRVLKEVAERGSFSAAADALNFTQSAVSQQIAALEKETGTTLLQRGPGGVRLTDAGRALVAHADVIMARLADAERELAAIAGLKGGRVRLASFPSAGATLVTEAVSLYRGRYPEVELSLTEGEPHETVPRLKRGDFDVAVVFEDSHSPGSELLRRPRLRAPARRSAVRGAARGPSACAAQGGPARRSGRRDLGGRLRRWGLRGDADRRLCPGQLHAPRRLRERRPQRARGPRRNGVGVALLPELCLRTAPPGIEVRPVSGSPAVAPHPRGGAGGGLPLARDRGDDRGPAGGQQAPTPPCRPPPER